MDFIYYLLFGIMDIVAIFVLMFKLYRIPLNEFKFHILVVATVVNLLSYLFRMVLDLPAIDPPVQLLIFILFLRYVCKFRVSSALLMAACGYASFVSIQFVVYNVMDALKWVSQADAQTTSAFGTYLIQVTNNLLCYLCAFLLYRFNLGFAIIQAPPQDLMYRDKLINKPIYIFMLVCASLVCLNVVFINHFIEFILYVCLLFILSTATLIYFAYRKDFGYD